MHFKHFYQRVIIVMKVVLEIELISLHFILKQILIRKEIIIITLLMFIELINNSLLIIQMH